MILVGISFNFDTSLASFYINLDLRNLKSSSILVCVFLWMRLMSDESMFSFYHVDRIYFCIIVASSGHLQLCSQLSQTILILPSEALFYVIYWNADYFIACSDIMFQLVVAGSVHYAWTGSSSDNNRFCIFVGCK